MVLIEEMEERELNLDKIFLMVCNSLTPNFSQRRIDIVEYLVKKPSININAAINANGDTIFHIACKFGCEGLVDILL